MKRTPISPISAKKLQALGGKAFSTFDKGKPKGKAKGAKKLPAPSMAVLDSLFSQVIRQGANHECQFWGMFGIRCSSQMQTMHLKSRRFPSLRWDPLNAACGCAAHHRHFHDHPDRFYEAVEKLWPGRWEQVQAKWLAGKKPTPGEKRLMVERFRLLLLTNGDPWDDGKEGAA